MLNAFSNFLTRRPFFSRCLTGSIIVSTGDLISQFIIEKKTLQQYDPKRTLRTFVMGYTVISFNLYAWYNKILPMFFKSLPQSSIFRKYDVLTTTVLDQLLFAPYIAVSYLFFISIFQYFDVNKAIENVKENLKPVLITNYKFWPLVNYLNFTFVPFMYRIVVVNICAIFWNSYLAYINQKSVEYRKI